MTANPTLAELLVRLARTLSRFRGDSVESSALEEAADIAVHFGELCEKYRASATAYNYYEIAYHFGSIWDHPALAVAEKLRALSDPENVDQFHGAIWRLAIERVRHSCTEKGDWLLALDAFELALSCPVETAELQRQLCSSLEQQVRMAKGTPIEELVAIYFVQVPISGVPPEQRQMAIRLLCGKGGGEGRKASTPRWKSWRWPKAKPSSMTCGIASSPWNPPIRILNGPISQCATIGCPVPFH